MKDIAAKLNSEVFESIPRRTVNLECLMRRALFALRHSALDFLKDAEQLLLDIFVPSQDDLERMYALRERPTKIISSYTGKGEG
jgi:hypothetical protein